MTRASVSAALLALVLVAPLLSSCETNTRPSSSRISAREGNAWGTREEAEVWKSDRMKYFVTPPAQ